MNKNDKSCVVLCSGRGSNIPSILDAIDSKKIRVKIECLISNNPTSRSLKLAEENKIRAEILPAGKERDLKLITLIKEINPDFIVLAGYIKKIPAELTQLYKNKILNIHPSLLPKYGGKGMYGLNVHKAVIESGDKISGATVHLVNEVYDDGEIIIQETVAIEENDTPESLSSKVFELEKKLFPKAIEIFINTILK